MKHTITLLFLIVAIAFYSLGAIGPGTVFLVIGAIAEGAFWFRVLPRKRSWSSRDFHTRLETDRC